MKSIDEIRPETFKALNEGVLWLTLVCHVAWCSGGADKDWQIGVIIPVHKKGDRSECTNYRSIFLLSLPWKAYTKCLGKRYREINEPKLEHTQCAFALNVELQTKFSLSGKFSSNLASMSEVDGKMALYRECCFHDLYKIKANQVTFVGFKGAIAPSGSAPAS